MKINMKDTPIFIIHYKKMTNRKQFLDEWFQQNNIVPTWVLEGQREDITEDILTKYYREGNCGKLNFGEIGCMLGHISAMQKIVESDSNYGLIFEDDVYLTKTFQKDFDELFSNCPSDFDVVSLGSCCGIVHPNATSNPSFHKVEPPRGRCGYAQLISKRACEIALRESIPFSWPPDWQIYNISSNNSYHPFVTYWVEPPIAFEGSKNGTYTSSIR